MCRLTRCFPHSRQTRHQHSCLFVCLIGVVLLAIVIVFLCTHVCLVCFLTDTWFVSWLVDRLTPQQHATAARTDEVSYTCLRRRLLLVVQRPSNMRVYLRDGSAQTILRVATLSQKLQTKLSISPGHSILTPGLPVPALTL